MTSPILLTGGAGFGYCVRTGAERILEESEMPGTAWGSPIRSAPAPAPAAARG